MADKQDFEIDGKLLSQLRVVDLKQELEKRGLPKSGSKKDLLDRLKVQLQLEQLQQTVSQDDGHVPNLALQDDAIGEQSDLIKEYLAKQQEVYEIQKEARRRVEMEEEEELKKHSKEGGDVQEHTEKSPVKENVQSMSPVKPSGDIITDQGKGEEPATKTETAMETKENVISETEDKSASIADENKISKHVEDPVQGLNLSVKSSRRSTDKVQQKIEEKKDSLDKISEQVSEVEQPKDVEKPVEQIKEGNQKDEGDVVATPVNKSDKSNEDTCPGTTNTPRSLRPRLRRDVFQAEIQPKKNDRRATEKQSVAPKPETEEVSSTKPKDDDTMRSRLRNRTKLQREASSCSSSSSRSQSPGGVSGKKVAVPQESSSNSSSSRDESPSESVSSNGTSDVKTSRFKTRSKAQQEEYRDDEPSSSPPAEKAEPRTKRTRINRAHSQTPDEDVSWQRSTPTENPEDVITTQVDEEEIETKADDSEMNEMEKPTHDSNISEASMDVDNKSDEINEQQNSEREKEDPVKPPTRVHMRKLSLSSSKESSQNKDNLESPSEGEKPVRKRKWGCTSTATGKKTSIAISTDSLKDLIPDVKPLSSLLASDNALDFNEGPPSDAEDSRDVKPTTKEVRIVRTVTQDIIEHEKENFQTDEQRVEDKNKTVTKPISLADEPTGRIGSPSPARYPISRIIHIRNLVRPFTINQLKELLGRTGTLVEGGFWTDKIKSKCYATYETEEQAVTTRQALHGSQWPPSNRKNLSVDYAQVDELQFHMSLTDPLEIARQTREVEPPPREPVRRVREAPAPAPKVKDQKPAPPPPPIREWDKVKIGERSPGERERRKRTLSPQSARGDRKRAREVREKRDKKDRKKEEEEAPAKLLDDLFKKTKSAPCIYWLPLTVEQIKQREEDRKKRQVEREKRRQQIKKDATMEKEKTTVMMRETKKPTRTDDSRSRKRSESPARNRPRKR